MNFTETNAEIRQWTRANMPLLKAEIKKLGIIHRSYSPSPRAAANSLRSSTRQNRGLINKIGYSMPRHMVFVHKGVGRGTPIALAGQTNRKAKPWYNPVIERRMDELADIVANGIGGEIINNIFIK